MNILTKVIAAAAVLMCCTSAWAAPRTIRIATHVSKVSPLYDQAQLFADEISKKLPGEFDFKIYPNGQLGKEDALINNAKLGSIEMIVVASGVLKLDGKLGIFDLPWLFKNYDQVEKLSKGSFGQAVKKRIEDKQNLVVLGMYASGFRQVINNRRPIVHPADMKGLKIRVTGSKYRREGFSQLGADPQPIAWTETFTAIQQGVVDGAEASIYAFYGAKLYEINKYISLTRHSYTPSFLIASPTFWASLSDQQKKAFREAAADITDKAYADAQSLDQRYLKKMKDDVKVNEVDSSAFQAKVKPVYQEYEKKYGSKWVDMIQSTN